MSAPLVVNTRDGVCWTRRTVTSGGIALYAPESVKTCPDFVMATEAELAEHGIVGSADALPMPVGPEPQGERLSIARIAEIQQRAEAATPGPWEEHAAYGENFYAYLGGPYLRGVGTLNFGDGDDAEADKALTVNAREDIRALLAELFTVRAELRVARGRVAELEAAPTTVYRAEHPDAGITLGHYGTKKAARAHCEDLERRSWPEGTTLAFDWIEDDEDRVAELMVTAGQNEESTTGYIVTALELDSEYDPDGDE
jgi:hypothetical protein